MMNESEIRSEALRLSINKRDMGAEYNGDTRLEPNWATIGRANVYADYIASGVIPEKLVIAENIKNIAIKENPANYPPSLCERISRWFR